MICLRRPLAVVALVASVFLAFGAAVMAQEHPGRPGGRQEQGRQGGPGRQEDNGPGVLSLLPADAISEHSIDTPGGKLNPAPAGTDLKLAVTETELKALKEMVTELRQARDDWKAQAGHLVLAAPSITARAPADTPSALASAPTAAPEPERPTS